MYRYKVWTYYNQPFIESGCKLHNAIFWKSVYTYFMYLVYNFCKNNVFAALKTRVSYHKQWMLEYHKDSWNVVKQLETTNYILYSRLGNNILHSCPYTCVGTNGNWHSFKWMRLFPSWTSKESEVHYQNSNWFLNILFSCHCFMHFIIIVVFVYFFLNFLQYREAKNMCMPFCLVMKPSMFVKWSSLGMVGFFFHW